MADLRHLGFYGSNNGFFEKPVYDFLNCLVFEKSRFCILATDRPTNRWTGPLHEAALALASGGLKAALESNYTVEANY